MAEKTSWEVELDEDVSPAARKAETALGRLQKMIQRFSSIGMSKAMVGLNQVRDRVSGIGNRALSRIPGVAAMRGQKMGPFRKGSADQVASVGGWRGGLGLLGHGVAAGFDRAKKAIDSAHKSWNKWNNSAKFNKVAEWSKNAVMLVAAAAAAMTAMTAGILVATTRMADFGQRSRAAFSMMLGSQELGEIAFERSRQLAKELGMDIREVAGSYQRFLSMGFDQAGAEELIKMGADMSALGASAEKVSSVLDAMGKIQATGTLQGDELMMLAEAGINIGAIYDRLGQKFGKTRGEIVKMKEAGKITSDDAIQAIKDTVLATTKQTNFGMARKGVIANTLGGGWDKLKAEVRDKMIGIADASAPALARSLNAVNTRLTKILNSSDGSVIQDTIVRGIEWVALKIEQAIPLIEEFGRSFVAGFKEAAVPLHEIGAGLSDSFGGNKAEMIRSIARSLGMVAAVLGAAAVVIGGVFTAAVYAASKAIEYLVRMWSWARDVIGGSLFRMIDAKMNTDAQMTATGNGWRPPGGGIGPDLGAQVNGIKTGSAGATNVQQTAQISVTAQAPPGGTREDGQAWGEGTAKGLARQQMRFFEDLNVSQGT